MNMFTFLRIESINQEAVAPQAVGVRAEEARRETQLPHLLPKPSSLCLHAPGVAGDVDECALGQGSSPLHQEEAQVWVRVWGMKPLSAGAVCASLLHANDPQNYKMPENYILHIDFAYHTCPRFNTTNRFGLRDWSLGVQVPRSAGALILRPQPFSAEKEWKLPTIQVMTSYLPHGERVRLDAFICYRCHQQ